MRDSDSWDSGTPERTGLASCDSKDGAAARTAGTGTAAGTPRQRGQDFPGPGLQPHRALTQKGESARSSRAGVHTKKESA